MATRKKLVDDLMHGWRKSGNDLASSHQQFREAVLNHPAIKMALINYINGLNLQGQVNNGTMTENQALKAFHDAGQQFLRELNTHINTNITQLQNKPELNQIDLSNPINMQNQLNIPGSLANLMMDDVATSIADDMNIQTSLIQAQNQQTEENEQTQDNKEAQNNNDDDQNSPASSNTNDLEKGAEITAGLKAMDDLDPAVGKKAVEDAFHKVTGIKEGSFDGLEKDATDLKESAEKKFAPKPTPRDIT
jgi:hypothetical protein